MDAEKWTALESDPKSKIYQMQVIQRILDALDSERPIQAILFGVVFEDGDDSRETPKLINTAFGTSADLFIILQVFMEKLNPGEGDR